MLSLPWLPSHLLPWLPLHVSQLGHHFVHDVWVEVNAVMAGRWDYAASPVVDRNLGQQHKKPERKFNETFFLA
jgi:hypothetical protein